MLPRSHQEALKSKYRVGIRIIHRCISTSATDLFALVKERRLEEYVAAYLNKRLLKMHKSDLGKSLFINDLFYWDNFTNKCARQRMNRKKVKKLKRLQVGHFFRLKRVRKMIEKHESYLIRWFTFIEDHSK